VKTQLFWHDRHGVLAGLGPFQPGCGPYLLGLENNFISRGPPLPLFLIFFHSENKILLHFTRIRINAFDFRFEKSTLHFEPFLILESLTDSALEKFLT